MANGDFETYYDDGEWENRSKEGAATHPVLARL